MAKIIEKLSRGETLYILRPTPGYIQDTSGGFKDICHHAHILLIRDSSQLVFKIWDVKNNSRVTIDGQSTFFFDILPHSEFKEDGDCIKGYEYRPRGEYGICDCEKYDGGSLEAIINCLIIDLIESSKKV